MKKNDILEILMNVSDFIKKHRTVVMAMSVVVVFITTYVLILPALTLDEDTAEEQGGIDVHTEQAISDDSDQAEPQDENNEVTAAEAAQAEKASAASGAAAAQDYHISISTYDHSGLLPKAPDNIYPIKGDYYLRVKIQKPDGTAKDGSIVWADAGWTALKVGNIKKDRQTYSVSAFVPLDQPLDSEATIFYNPEEYRIDPQTDDTAVVLLQPTGEHWADNFANACNPEFVDIAAPDRYEYENEDNYQNGCQLNLKRAKDIDYSVRLSFEGAETIEDVPAFANNLWALVSVEPGTWTNETPDVMYGIAQLTDDCKHMSDGEVVADLPITGWRAADGTFLDRTFTGDEEAIQVQLVEAPAGTSATDIISGAAALATGDEVSGYFIAQYPTSREYPQRVTKSNLEKRHTENIFDVIAMTKDEAKVEKAKEKEQSEAEAEKQAAEEAAAEKDAEKAAEKDASEKKETAPAKAGVLTCEGDGYTVTAAYGEDAQLPENTELSVREITESDKEYQSWYEETQKALEDDADGEKAKGLQFAKFYDITFSVDGKEIEPAAPVDVTISYDKAPKVENVDNLKVVHFGEDKKGDIQPEVLDANDVDATIDRKDKMTETTFTAENFSVYAITYTVDFHYNVDGKNWDYSINGGTTVALSDLIGLLGVNKTETSDEEFVQKISDVEFSDPKLVKVSKVEKDTVVDAQANDTGDNEDELWTVDSPDAKAPKESAFEDNSADEFTVKRGDWLLESLKPFSSDETLTITMEDGEVFTVQVTDAQYGTGNIEIGNDGKVNLTDIATITATAQSNTTEVGWDVTLDFLLRYVMTDDGLDAIIDYTNKNGHAPDIVYDFSQVFDQSALSKAEPATHYLSTGLRTVGKLTVSENGSFTITLTDLNWLVSRSTMRGTVELGLQVSETEAQEHDHDTITFPGTTTGIDISYKGGVTNSKKTLNGAPIANSDGSYTMNYTASLDVNSALSTLYFSDVMDGLQGLVANSVKVNGTPVSGLTNGAKSFSFEVGDVVQKNSEGKIPAGRYNVTYSTKISAEQMRALQEGEKTTGSNTSHWKANGEDVNPDGHASYEITKPIKQVPVKKTVVDNGTNAVPGGSIHYNVVFGDETTDLGNLKISDNMSDLEKVNGKISISYVDAGGTRRTINIDPSAQSSDNSYSWNMVQVFEYTFGNELSGVKGPVTVDYSTTLLTADEAKQINVFGNVSISNIAKEHKTNNTSSVSTNVKFPDAPQVTVEKTGSVADEYKNPDGSLKPGAEITYTIVIDSSNHDLSNVSVRDAMSRLQHVDASTAKITVGGHEQSLASYAESLNGFASYNYGTGMGTADLFNFVFPENTIGPVTITYTTKVITQDEATDLTIYGPKNSNNTINVGNKSDSEGWHIDFQEEPKFPLEKTADKTEAQPDDEINYTVKFGGEGFRMDGARLFDEMTDIQKLDSDVTVTLNKPLLRSITWPDGTTWAAGQTTFTMPIASSMWAEDGVVWTDFFDDGQYYVNQNARVFVLRLPDGGANNPYFADGTELTTTYRVKTITEEDALDFGIIDKKNANNRATAGNNSAMTTVPVDFPSEITHKPAIEKSGAGFDVDRDLVYWTIHVTADKANGSTYPLKNVDVMEMTTNSGVSWENPRQQKYYQKVDASDFKLLESVVTTDSGIVLQPGEDYFIDKDGSGEHAAYTEGENQSHYSHNGNPTFSFPELNEGVTIKVCYGIKDNSIIDGFTAHNTVSAVTSKDSYSYDTVSAKADQSYTNPNIDVTKNGDVKDSRYVEWTVRVNPSMREYANDDSYVIFDDIIPDGHVLVNYADKRNHDNPTIQVKYDGVGDGQVSGHSRFYNFPKGTKHIRQDISDLSDQPAYGSYSHIGLDKQRFVVKYYTYITDEEWDSITSSLTGSRTYTNTAKIDVEGDDDFEASADATITSDGFLWKQDTTVEDSNGVVIDPEQENNRTNYISYKIDVNPYAMQLVSEEGATMTLTDRIATNMDLDTDTVVVEFSDGKDGQTEHWTDINQDDRFKDVTISYNDDSRYLTIDRIPDKVHIRVLYKTVSRHQGTEVYENTATLTGGGSHSATTREEHTIQRGKASIAGETASLQLRKIDENNITKKLEGAEFELYECTLQNPDNWKKTVTETTHNSDGTTGTQTLEHLDFNKIESVVEGGTDEQKAKLKNDFKIVERKQVGGTLKSNKNGIVTTPKLKEETLYYWVETATVDGYTAELNVPHYFVVYNLYDDDGNLRDDDTEETRDGSSGNLKDWEARQWRGWSLDDASQYANGIRVASMSMGLIWTVNNQKGDFTTVSATKKWADDYDDFYETRPSEGVQMKLWQIGDDGTKVQYGPVIPINADKDGVWPTYTWTQLPASKIITKADGTKQTIHYTYKVEELPVEGYRTSYSAGNEVMPDEGVASGEVTVTNSLIPTKTSISVKKDFEQDSNRYPDQILVNLYEITTPRDGGETSRAKLQTYALTADNDWSYTWKNLPTRDKKGNTLTYTVEEDTKALGDEYHYTVEYSDEGKGVGSAPADDPLVITNIENGLEIVKTCSGDSERLMADNEAAQAMRELIVFTVKDNEGHSATFNLNQMKKNAEGRYSYKLTPSVYPWISEGNMITVTETNAAFTNTELKSVTYTVNGGEKTKVTDDLDEVAAEGIELSDGIDTVVFDNEYEEEKAELKVNKEWFDIDGDPTGWPEGVNKITFYLTADEGDGPVLTGEQKSMKSGDETVTFKDLPKHVLNSDREVRYSVKESLDGYTSSVQRNDDGSVTVQNRKASPRLYVKKVWRGSDDFIPASLTVDLYDNETKFNAGNPDQAINTITITAEDQWKGYFDTDKDGNELVLGTKYFVRERGVGGWTLQSYSDENGQPLEDLATVTIKNTRDEHEGDTSIGVQKKWKVNDSTADTDQWEPVNVQLVRYKAEKPSSAKTVQIAYNADSATTVFTDIMQEVSGNTTIYLNYNKSATWFSGQFEYEVFTIDLMQHSSAWDYVKKDPAVSVGGKKTSVNGKIVLNLNQAAYSTTSKVYVVIYNTQGQNPQTTTAPTIEGEEMAVDDLVWTGPEVMAGMDKTLNADNAWQYEFTDLPTEGTELNSGIGSTTYFYRYDVVETSSGTATSTEIERTGGDSLLMPNGNSVETGGTVKITNKKEKGSITVNKTMLKNDQPDTEMTKKTIKVGLFDGLQAAGSTARPLQTKELTLEGSGGSVTFTNLDFGTYYAYELDERNCAIVEGATAIVGGEEYTVNYNGDAQQSEAVINAVKKTAIVEIANERTTQGEFEFVIEKIDNSTKAALTGAEFRVEKITEGSPAEAVMVKKVAESGTSNTYEMSSDEDAVSVFAVGADGKVKITGLLDGTYRIIETKSPEGYIVIDSEPATFTVTGGKVTDNPTLGEAVTYSAGTNTFTVGNEAGAELPKSGGMGTTWIYILGALLFIGCGVVLIARRRMRA